MPGRGSVGGCLPEENSRRKEISGWEQEEKEDVKRILLLFCKLH